MVVIVYCKGVPRHDWRVFARAWRERGSACLTFKNGTVVTHRGWVRTSCVHGTTTLSCAATECTVDAKSQALIFPAEGCGGGGDGQGAEGVRALSFYALVA